MPDNDPWATLSDEDRYCRPWHQPKTIGPVLPAERFHDRTLPPWGDRKPDLWCEPHCLQCNRFEASCRCQPKTLICDHTTPPVDPADGARIPKPVPVCITNLRVPAALRTGAAGRDLLVVTCCPHCEAAHPHTNHPMAHSYRVAPCGQPYLLETTP